MNFVPSICIKKSKQNYPREQRAGESAVWSVVNVNKKENNKCENCYTYSTDDECVWHF